jgi:transcriptional regulator with XRE-family HTH domain
MERSERPFSEELPALLAERGLTQVALAREIGVTQPHISRILRGANYRRTPSTALVGRAALALGLPVDYWPEYRMAKVVDRLGGDARLRDEIFDSLPQDVREAVPPLREDRYKGQRRPGRRRAGKPPPA